MEPEERVVARRMMAKALRQSGRALTSNKTPPLQIRCMECPLREPKLEFRKYQKDVLEKISLQDMEMLIVAPPGSGKTIIGLEIMRRIGAPAIVFSPTTVIARQWKEKLSFFCDRPDEAASLESEDPAFISIFTYQRISTRAQATDAMARMAREMWSKELQKTLSPEDAEKELSRIEKKNARFYEKRLATFISKLRNEYDRSVIEKGLHRNALALIGRMKDAGVKVIILDECHHLLDYWGLVIKYLKDVLGAQVIGLTATYPIAEERDIFFELLGQHVDYEVSVPAVVKEGYLAPYRELALFVTPTNDEIRFIKSEIDRVETAFSSIAAHSMFADFFKWATDGELFKEDYPLYQAVVSFGGRLENVNHDGKLLLIKGFLDYAYPLMGEDERNAAFHMLRACGMAYSNRALRMASTVEKYILSYSDARVKGALDILRRESSSEKENLRALVMADFDMHVPGRKLRPGKEMGSATYIFMRMARELDELNPVLVTGTKLYCDDDIAERLCAEIERLAKGRKLDVRVSHRPMDGFAIIEGSGKDWKPSTYTLLVTELFSAGMTRLLIGTKGIFGEGWDSLKLNTLIDLTAISFGTSVQQIKGRTLRLDPEDQAKVSHNWDVVCVYPGMGTQLSKLRRKHGLVYGIDDEGNITKGLHHVDKNVTELEFCGVDERPFYAALGRINERMAGRANDRAKTHSLWGVGTIYDDQETMAVSAKMNRKIVPVQTLGWFYGAIFLTLTSSLIMFGLYGIFGGDALCCLGSLILWLAFFASVSCASYVYLLRNPMPDEKVVAGIAKTVFNTLKRLGATDDSATFKLSILDDGKVEAALYGKGSREFAQAMEELLSRPINPRYIILYDVARPLHLLFGLYGAFSYFAERVGVKKQFFAVPSLFAANKKNMEIFASEWEMHIGGGKFVYTRSEEGAKLLQNLVHASVTDWLADASARLYWDYVDSVRNRKGRNVIW
ncbi:DEAD/DEAH box helicase family protein [Candidatus Micrarchaeota archaeon]|nr:DEAD/DEAH box helicase family protein [Candidatus Micrarchaeota archaeon]